MRTLRKNQQALFYSNLIGTAPIYETDEDGNIKYYEDSEGNRYPLDTGETELIYGTPVEFYANLSMSGGEAEAVEYGLSVADYQCTAVYQKNAYPIKEGTLIWHKSPIEYEYGGTEIEIETENGEKVLTTAPIEVSSDYQVIKVSESLNVTKIILKATNK